MREKRPACFANSPPNGSPDASCIRKAEEFCRGKAAKGSEEDLARARDVEREFHDCLEPLGEVLGDGKREELIRAATDVCRAMWRIRPELKAHESCMKKQRAPCFANRVPGGSPDISCIRKAEGLCGEQAAKLSDEDLVRLGTDEGDLNDCVQSASVASDDRLIGVGIGQCLREWSP